MSAIGDTLIALGETLPATLRQRKEDAAKRKIQEEENKRKAEADAISGRYMNAQVDEYNRKAEKEKTEAARFSEGLGASADTVADIESGKFRNPDLMIEDPELEKEKAITANYGQVLDTVNAKPLVLSPETSKAYNKSVIDTTGLAGLSNLRAKVEKTDPADYYRSKTAKLQDLAPVKEVQADYQKRSDAEAAAMNTAAQKEEERLFRASEEEKNRQLRRDIAGESAATRRDAKEITFGNKENQQQDKLEQQYRDVITTKMPRNPAFRFQDQKISSAIHSRQAMEGTRDENGNLHINQIVSPELALSLATLISGKTTTNIEEFKAMDVQSLEKDIKNMVGKITGKPVDVLPKEWADTIQHMIDRQGVISEGIRDKYLEQYRKFKPTRLDPERAKIIESTKIGPSYSEMFGMTPEEKDRIVNPGKYLNKAGSSDAPKPSGALSVLDEIRARRQAKGK